MNMTSKVRTSLIETRDGNLAKNISFAKNISCFARDYIRVASCSYHASVDGSRRTVDISITVVPVGSSLVESVAAAVAARSEADHGGRTRTHVRTRSSDHTARVRGECVRRSVCCDTNKTIFLNPSRARVGSARGVRLRLALPSCPHRSVIQDSVVSLSRAPGCVCAETTD